MGKLAIGEGRPYVYLSTSFPSSAGRITWHRQPAQEMAANNFLANSGVS